MEVVPYLVGKYCHVFVCVSIDGVRLDIGFIDHLYTPLGTTSTYSAIANLHTLQITTASAKSFPSRSLTTASNSGDSSVSRTHVVTAG
jgi:hypothetical protein